MKFEIKHKYSGRILFSLETTSFRLCVKAAIKADTYLSGADLSGVDLSGADLSSANLSGADLSSADLSGADLSSANLSGADLSSADLSSANLSGAHLFRADLSSANLSGAHLSSADLSSANLFRADLSGAHLFRADLSSAHLFRAKNAELIIAQTQICPTEGAFVGWKKLQDNVIARLVIPHDAERVNSYSSRKCRASKVIVHEIFGATEAYDNHTGKTLYKQGCEVIPDRFDGDLSKECTHGIHFFLTRIEAENY